MVDQQDAAVRIAVLETQIKGLKENIVLQAKEYERRLTELNHAHDQAVTDKAKFVNLDIFYAKLEEISKWRSEMDSWRNRVIGIYIGLGLASGVVSGLITVMVSRFFK